jgi:hypothetical protein
VWGCQVMFLDAAPHILAQRPAMSTVKKSANRACATNASPPKLHHAVALEFVCASVVVFVAASFSWAPLHLMLPALRSFALAPSIHSEAILECGGLPPLCPTRGLPGVPSLTISTREPLRGADCSRLSIARQQRVTPIESVHILREDIFL